MTSRCWYGFARKPALLGKYGVIRVGPGRGNEQPDPWPVLRGMMRKGQAVHCSGHVDVGEQYVDAVGVALSNNHGGFSVLGFHNLSRSPKDGALRLCAGRGCLMVPSRAGAVGPAAAAFAMAAPSGLRCAPGMRRRPDDRG
jgi:hypothetical protein